MDGRDGELGGERGRGSVRAVAATLLTALLAVAGGVTWQHRSARQAAQAAVALGDALIPQNGTVALLKHTLDGGSPDAGESDTQVYSTQKEKDAALATSLQGFVASHSGSSALTARLQLAHAQLRLGDPQAALANYQLYLDDAAPTHPLRPSALEGMGLAYEAQGKVDEALAAFDRLTNDGNGKTWGGMGKYHRARLLLRKSQTAEAIQLLEEVSNLHAGSPSATLALQRVQQLQPDPGGSPP